MTEFLTFFFMFAAAVFLIWVLLYFYRRNLNKEKSEYADRRLKHQKTEDGGIDFVRCPLCNTPLAQGEDMVSRIFHPMNTPDQRMNVLGCPHCYPKLENGASRVCPVCRKNVPMDGYLIARLFNRDQNKKHVMITGCTQCYGPKKKK